MPELDDYLQRFAGQNERAGVSQHFVAVPAADGPSATGRSSPHVPVLGYYALSAGAVAFDDVPDELKKRLPHYPVPVAHLGRLAVDVSMQGRGLGEDLLIDALARILRVGTQIGIQAVEVVAINENATQFYLRYGFTPLRDDPRHLYLPLSTVRKLGLA